MHELSTTFKIGLVKVSSLGFSCASLNGETVTMSLLAKPLAASLASALKTSTRKQPSGPHIDAKAFVDFESIELASRVGCFTGAPKAMFS